MALPSAGTTTKVTLYGVKVSNYTARCAYIMRRKSAPSDVFSLCEPADLGGIKSEDYMRLNPLGKMPLLTTVRADGTEDALFESSVICEYLAETFDSLAPSFQLGTPEARAKARLIANLLDLYVGVHHPFMYKNMDGVDRAAGVKNMLPGFDAIEHALDATGPYAAGATPSVADCCLWGNFAFYDFMLPTFFGWNPVDGRPKLAAWRAFMASESPAAKETYLEVFTCLQGWWDSGRWEKLGMKPLTGRPEPSL